MTEKDMENYNISIDLLKLMGAEVTQTRSGRTVLCIDLGRTTPALLYNSEKGTAYLFLNAWLNRDRDGSPQPDRYGKTHVVKPSVTAKDREAGLDDRSILGNMRPLRDSGQKPQQQPQQPRYSAPQDDDDDLPF